MSLAFPKNSPYNAKYYLRKQKHDMNHTDSPYETPSPHPAPNPQPQGDYTHPTYDNSSQHRPPRKAMIIAIIVGATFLVLLTAALFLAAMTPKKVIVTKEPEPVAPAKIAPLTAELTLKHLKTHFKGTESAKTSLATPIRASGKSFYTVVTDVAMTKNSAGAVPIKDTEPLLASLRKSLSADKFNETVLNSGDANGNFLASYLREDVVCQLLLDKSNPSQVTYWLEAKCLDMAQYNDLADAQSVFYDLYAPARSFSSPTAFLGTARVQPGKTAGYEIAEQDMATVIDGAKTQDQLTALYYRGSGKAWTYFTDQPAPLDCKLYQTNDLKASYQGTVCIDTVKHQPSTVTAPKLKSS